MKMVTEAVHDAISKIVNSIVEKLFSNLLGGTAESTGSNSISADVISKPVTSNPVTSDGVQKAQEEVSTKKSGFDFKDLIKKGSEKLGDYVSGKAEKYGGILYDKGAEWLSKIGDNLKDTWFGKTFGGLFA